MDEYLSHALAYVFLHKFGGFALNFDVLLTQPVGPLGQFVSRCDDDAFAPFPLALNSGHALLEDALDEFGRAFSKGDARSTGEDLLTNRLKKHCRVHVVSELQYKDCAMLQGVK